MTSQAFIQLSTTSKQSPEESASTRQLPGGPFDDKTISPPFSPTEKGGGMGPQESRMGPLTTVVLLVGPRADRYKWSYI